MNKPFTSANPALLLKFTHNKRIATTIYYHTCKFTGKLFVSPNRRPTYSPEGLELKRIQDAELKAAKKRVCKVYFYLCPITNRWFTTRKAGSRFSPESKAITHQLQLDYAREHRKRPEVKQRERLRSQKPERKQYRREWMRQRASKGA